MLIGAFEVKIGRPFEIRTLLQDSAVARARVDPDVERVGATLQLISARPAVREGDAVEDFGGGFFKPEVGTGHGDLFRDRPDHIGINVGFTVFVIESGDRHTPGTLAADTPVGAVFDGSADTVLSPTRDKVDVVERFKCTCAVAVLIEGDKPLIHRAEDHGGL